MEKDLKDKPIDPIIYYGPAGCPKCGGVLCCADMEINSMLLDHEGNPREIETTNSCRAICINCVNQTKMMYHNGKYSVYSRFQELINEYEDKLENKKRVEELNRNAKKNPFLD